MLCLVLSYVLFLCHLVSLLSLQCLLHVLPFVFSPSSLDVCLPVSIVFYMLSPLWLSLVISPVLFPPLSAPVPRPLISVSVYFVPHVLLVSSLLMLSVMFPMKSLCFLVCLLFLSGMFLVFDFCFSYV